MLVEGTSSLPSKLSRLTRANCANSASKICTRSSPTRSKIATTRIDTLIEAREAKSRPNASYAKGWAIGLLLAPGQPIFSPWSTTSKEWQTLLHTRLHTTLLPTTSLWAKALPTPQCHQTFLMNIPLSHQACAGGFYFRALSQLDGCSPSRSSPSASPSTLCTLPTPSMPSGTWYSQIQTCELTHVVNVYEYGKLPVYPGPAIYYHSTDTPGNKSGLNLSFEIPTLHQPSLCNRVDCWED